MRLSTRSEYGLRAMAALAQRSAGAPVPLRTLASSEGISEPYLEQIFISLKKAGMVHSVRGARGGYLLSRPPERIQVGELLEVLEGDLAPYDCVADPEHDCDKLDGCRTRKLWMKMHRSVVDSMNEVTLADVAQGLELPV